MVRNLICCLFIGISAAALVNAGCEDSDFHPEFTECDSDGKHWLMWVPKEGCENLASRRVPQRSKCDTECKSGSFWDLNAEVPECKPCEPGKYSRGSSLRFENWTSEFSGATTFRITNDGSLTDSSDSNCSAQGWRVVNNRLMTSISDLCSSELTFSAKITRNGYVRFYYQYTDPAINFQFDVSNGRCSFPMGNGRAAEFTAKLTNSSDFISSHYESYLMPLSVGVNILRWTVSRFSQSLNRRPTAVTDSSRWRLPQVRIAAIEISGLSFVPKCTDCAAGTFSTSNSSSCFPCPRDTYSGPASSDCTPCDAGQYAEPGSSRCYDKPTCNEQHYFMRPGVCKDGSAELKADWIQPKVCQGGSLPKTRSIACKDCNAGMYLKVLNQTLGLKTCEFCPDDTPFSDGTSACKACPPNTVPQIGLAYHWFHEMPPGMHTLCTSGTDSCPDGSDGWQPAGSFLQTSPIRLRDSQQDLGDFYQLLLMHMDDGFITPTGFAFSGTGFDIQTTPYEIAKLTVELEIICQRGHRCELTLSGSRHRHSSSRSGLIRSWKDHVSRETFTYTLRSASETTFTFAFSYNISDDRRKREADSSSSGVSLARIFSIVVSNVKGAGATDCKACDNSTLERCVPCSDGFYMNADGSCFPCPANSVSFASKLYSVVPNMPRGIDVCVPCGHGLRPDSSRSRCVLDCSRKLVQPNTNFSFDLSAFSGVHAVTSHRVFSPQGQPFFYLLNFTVCEEQTLVRCIPPPPGNSTASNSKVSNRALTEQDDEDFEFGQQACYVTVLPSTTTKGNSRSRNLWPAPGDSYFAPVNLGVSVESVLLPGMEEATRANLSSLLTEAGFEPSPKDSDVFIVYEGFDDNNDACSNGRYLVLTLRCDVDAPANVSNALELPPDCPEGTCDGCVYITVWRSRAACPICDPLKDVRTLLGECIRGQQTVYYEPMPHCYLQDLDALNSRSQVQSCPYLPMEAYVALGIAALLLVGSVTAACTYRSKTRKLQYKYMRLVAQAGGQYGGELAGAESCAVQEGELDESAVDEQHTLRKGHKNKSRSGNGQQTHSDDQEAAASDEDELNVNFKNMKLQPMRSEGGDQKVSALSRIIGRFKTTEDRGSSLIDDDTDA